MIVIEIFEEDFLLSASWIKECQGNWLFTEKDGLAVDDRAEKENVCGMDVCSTAVAEAIRAKAREA